MIWIIFVGVGVLIITIMALSLLAAKKRREALSLIAEALNLTFTPKADASLIASLQDFSLFTKGHSKKAMNVMQGCANEINLTILDYQYTTGGGKNSSTFEQTVILFQSPQLNLPPFTVRPEHFFHRIGSAFGYQDIDFDTHPEFSKMYLLQGDNEQEVRDFFTDALFAFYTEHPGFCTETKGDQLIFYRFAKKAKPEMIKAFMQEGFALFTILVASSKRK
ncbi:MAG: hypothetical protein EOM12_17095 [Verrucomicrobiae bacterium]|nr:hypothetical protein [Verrucomicrobiae bacterium]